MRNMVERSVVHARALKRLAMWHFGSKQLPLYLVPEFPKSGGTWFSQMLSECIGVPFARNTTRARLERSVLSGHHLFSPRFHNVTVVIRDGRDVMVSAYYYMLFKNEINKQFGVDRHRSHLRFRNYDDIQSNLPVFIEYMFTRYPSKRFHFSWAEFIDSWIDRNVPVVRYEDLLHDAARELERVTTALTGETVDRNRVEAIVAKYSFKNVSGRSSGNEDKTSFVRKGIAGDWKNQFTSEACQVFERFAGPQLIRAGYEPDSRWIHRRSTTNPSSSDPEPTLHR